MNKYLMKNIVALCKRRGIIFPNSDIYGGFANTWDYGPYGVLLKNNVKQAWWNTIVKSRDDVVGLDSAILMNPKVWEASGHLKEFSDSLVECSNCNKRFKADYLYEQAHSGESWKKRMEFILSLQKSDQLGATQDSFDECPNCNKKRSFQIPHDFNLMFKTNIGPVEDSKNIAYLRPETAQGIFVNFKNVLDSTRVKIPFGIAQIGKAFRNEITPGNFTFRTLEFEQFELEYFVESKDADEVFKKWVEDRFNWYVDLGINKKNLAKVPHPKSDLAHYAKAVTDIEYKFPFGQSELEGIANRGDYDLKQHQELSGKSLEYTPVEGKKFLPHVIEPSGGVDRAILAFLVDAYKEDKVNGETRIFLSLHSKLAPIKVAILPLVKKDAKLVKIAKDIYEDLKDDLFVEYDDGGTIGKRYRRQDEIGTPFCITIDDNSIKSKKVTVRFRDSMKQKSIKISEIKDFLNKNLK